MFSRQIRVFLATCLILPLLIGYSTPSSFASPRNPNYANSQTQGVSGTVVRLSGNQMPTFENNSPRSGPKPVKTTVWVFSGRIPGQGVRWAVNQAKENPQLVTQIKTDNKGKFFVKLPPGEYTLFAQYGSDLYLNSFLGDGSYQSVEVNPDKITEIRLLNTEAAAF